MDIVLYNNLSDLNHISKNIIALATVSAMLKNETEITAPVVRLNSAMPPAANYCYIPAFERYYYINKQNILPGGINELSLQCDVLMSFKSTILDSTVIAERSTNHCNKSLPDNLPLLAKRNVIYKKLIGGIGESDFFGSDKPGGASYSLLLSVINSRGQAPGGVPTISFGSTVDASVVRLLWNKVDNATAYRVYRKSGESEYQQLTRIITAPGDESYEYDDVLEVAGTYYYRVQAENNQALGDYSNILTYTYEG